MSTAPESPYAAPTPPSTPAPMPIKERVNLQEVHAKAHDMEMVVSGVTLFGLLLLPGWILDKQAALEPHLDRFSSSGEIAGLFFGLATVSALILAGGFAVHLALRAFWIGVISLERMFPDPPELKNISTLGPYQRQWVIERQLDLPTLRHKSDQWATIIYTLTVMLSIGFLLVGPVFFAPPVLFSLWLEVDFGYSFFAWYLIIIMPGLLIFLIDAKYLNRHPEKVGEPWVRRILEPLLQFTSTISFSRVLTPIMLPITARSGAKKVIWTSMVVGFLAGILPGLLILLIRELSLEGYLLERSDIDSTRYESLRTPGVIYSGMGPSLPSEVVTGTHLRLFLPYAPRRDNSALKERCPDLTPLPAKFRGHEDAVIEQQEAELSRCLRLAWTVKLNGQTVAIEDFVLFNRDDLDRVGLLGYLPVAELKPGRHQLDIQWDGGFSKEEWKGALRPRSYRIPFWYTGAER